MRPLMNPAFISSFTGGPSGPHGPYNGINITEAGAEYITYALPRNDFPGQTQTSISIWAFVNTINVAGTNALLQNLWAADTAEYSIYLNPGPPENLSFISANNATAPDLAVTCVYNIGAGTALTKSAWHHIYIECDMLNYSGTANPLGGRIWIDNVEITWDSVTATQGAGWPADLEGSMLYFSTGSVIAGRFTGDLKIAQVRQFTAIDGGTVVLPALWNGGAGLGTHYTNANQIQEILFTEQAGIVAADTSAVGSNHSGNTTNIGAWITGDFSETTF